MLKHTSTNSLCALNNAILIAIGIGVSITLLVVLLSSFSLVQTTPTSEIRSNLDPELLKLPNANLTDDQLIAKTRDLKEIKAFLSKYPDAKSEKAKKPSTGH